MLRDSARQYHQDAQSARTNTLQVEPRSVLAANISSGLQGCSHFDQQSVSRIKAPTSQFCITQATYSVAPGKMICRFTVNNPNAPCFNRRMQVLSKTERARLTLLWSLS